ncbi:MAG TPA: helix-turn-helix domain-containing protein [Gemmatimonadaceae bacterium]|nr:helix-turn-helix domain-containing protein [Gemmatimonadaceae bacterium]
MTAVRRGALRVVAYAPRERTRALLRASVPRKAGRVVVARTPSALARALRAELADAVVVDLGAPSGEPRTTAALARDYPSVAFLGVTPFFPVDAPAIAECAALDFADVLADGVDDAVLAPLLQRHGFTPRFAAALDEPPAALGLESALQVAAWRQIVRRGGRTVRTQEIAAALDVTREHLSRSFAAGAAATLKRVIDLVRLLAAAELAKNPGYDLGDVAHLLGYASSSHLSTAAQRLVGTRASSLSALRAVDLLERFARGAGRGTRD